VWQSSLLNGGGDVENLLINYRAFERNGEKGYNANYVIANLLPERDTGEGLHFFFSKCDPTRFVSATCSVTFACRRRHKNSGEKCQITADPNEIIAKVPLII
jgi:hypothetical protein